MITRVMLAILALCLAGEAQAASTINTTLPQQGLPYNASPIRQNFGAAAADVVALQTMNAGASAPSNPTLGMLWLKTPQNETLYPLYIWNNRNSAWVQIATLDSLNNLWITNVGGGLPVSMLADNTTELGSVPQTVITVTGAGPIYSLGLTEPAGTIKVLQFTGVTQLINNATSMILPGAADINTDAGAMAFAVALGSGNWQVLYYQTSTLQPAQGGTGRTSLTAHSVLIGEGTSPVNFAVPSVSGQVLLDNGASADPSFGPVPASGLSGVVAVANGGTGLSTFPIHGLLIGNDTSPMTVLAAGTLGYPLVSRGPSIDPIYQILNPVGGGTGQTTLTNHAVILGQAAAGVAFAAPGTAQYPLLSNGASSNPSFQQLDLGGAGVTGTIPAGKLPFTIPNSALVSANGTTFAGVSVGTNLQISGTTLSVIAGPTFSSIIVSGGITSSSIASSGTNAFSGTNTFTGTTSLGGTTTLADTITVTGSLMVTAASGEDRITLSAAANQSAWSSYQTTTIDRWLAGKNNTLEAGAASGSDYDIVRADDAGTPTGIPFRILRSNGAIRLDQMAVAGGGKNYLCIDPATYIVSMSAAVCP